MTAVEIAEPSFAVSLYGLEGAARVQELASLTAAPFIDKINDPLSGINSSVIRELSTQANGLALTTDHTPSLEKLKERINKDLGTAAVTLLDELGFKLRVVAVGPHANFPIYEAVLPITYDMELQSGNQSSVQVFFHTQHHRNRPTDYQAVIINPNDMVPLTNHDFSFSEFAANTIKAIQAAHYGVAIEALPVGNPDFKVRQERMEKLVGKVTKHSVIDQN